MGYAGGRAGSRWRAATIVNANLGFCVRAPGGPVWCVNKKMHAERLRGPTEVKRDPSLPNLDHSARYRIGRGKSLRQEDGPLKKSRHDNGEEDKNVLEQSEVA